MVGAEWVPPQPRPPRCLPSCRVICRRLVADTLEVMSIVDVDEGDVIRLGAEDRLYEREPITLRVTRIRHDLLACYGGEWIWLHGYALDDDDRERGWVRLLARVSALAGQSSRV